MTMRVLFLVVLLFAVLSAVAAIFEEQLGEREWHVKNIGMDLTLGIFGGKRLAISTWRDRVLASLSTTDGSIIWRQVLDEGAEIEKMAAMGDGSKLVTLSHSGQVVRSWSVVSGSLIWEQRLPLSISKENFDVVGNEAKDACVRDITVSSSGDVIVMSHNEMHVLTSADGALQSSWKSSKDEVMILSSFAAASDSASHDVQSLRIAVGCEVSSKTTLQNSIQLNAAQCDKTVVWEVSRSPGLIKTAKFDKLPSATAGKINGILTLDASKALDQKNSFFTQTEDKVSVFLPSSSSHFTVDVPKKLTSHLKSYPVVMLGSSPVVSSCSSSRDSTSGMYIEDCRAHIVDFKTKSLLPLVSCGSPTGYEVFITRAALSFGRSIASSQTVDSITCTDLHHNDDSHNSVRHITVTADMVPPVESEFIIPTIASGTQAIKTVISHTLKNKKSETMVRVLTMSSSGTVFFSDNRNGLVWFKEESLSAIKSVDVVDYIIPATEEIEDGSNIPNFSTRIRMQMKDLEKMTKNLPDTLLRMIMAPYKKITQPKDKKTREDKESEAAQFGFDKIAVMVTSTAFKTGGSLLDAGVKVVGVNQVHGEVAWSFEPSLEYIAINLPDHSPISNSQTELFMKLLVTKPHPIGTQPAEVVLVLSVALESQSTTFFFHIDPITGTCLDKYAKSNVMIIDVHGVPETSNTLNTHPFILIRKDGRVTTFPTTKVSTSDILAGTYTHSVDAVSGILQTYQITRTCSLDNGLEWCDPAPLSSVVFVPEKEQILATAVTHHDDKSISKSVIRGDDSLLLKYQNANMRVVVSSSRGVDEGPSILFITAVDTVSGRIIYRANHMDAEGPVCAVVVENNIIVSFWNNKAKRSEISSITLIEGMVDRHDLGPFGFANGKHNSRTEKAKHLFSSFSQETAIALNKTFIMPRPVVAMHQSITANGISNKDIIIAFENGQVYTLDRRQIDPRRPINPPVQRDLTEGLRQYSPFVFMNPGSCLTYNSTIPASNHVSISSFPSFLESTALVLVYGLDLYFVRTNPSQGFDLLSSTFDFTLLIVILTVMTFGVFYLRNWSKAKTLATNWK